MLHVGEHFYGVVDQVPGVLHVATRILHFNYIPIVPLGSVVSVDKRVAGEAIHVKTRLSLKSVAFAYLRIALVCAAVGLGLIGLIMWDIEKMQPNPPPWFQSLTLCTMGVALLVIFIWWWTHRLTLARYSRAIELADAIGMDREIIDENFRSRGLTPSEDAAPTMATVPDRWANEEKDDVYRLE